MRTIFVFMMIRNLAKWWRNHENLQKRWRSPLAWHKHRKSTYFDTVLEASWTVLDREAHLSSAFCSGTSTDHGKHCITSIAQDRIGGGNNPGHKGGLECNRLLRTSSGPYKTAKNMHILMIFGEILMSTGWNFHGQRIFMVEVTFMTSGQSLDNDEDI